jgi:hypothetical protein
MRKVVILAVLVLGAVYAYAGPTEYTFLAYTGGNWQNGYPYYIAPTQGPNGQIYAVMCDDYAHGGQVGDQWEATVTNLGSGNIMLTRFNKLLQGPTALANLQLYDEAGWILLQTQVTPTPEWQAMNYAVWHIFDTAAPLIGDAQSWLDAASQEAKLGFPGVDFNKVYIVTPTNQYDPDPNSIQEFMYIGSDPSSGAGAAGTTPEPGTLVLLGTGLLAMFGRKFLN